MSAQAAPVQSLPDVVEKTTRALEDELSEHFVARGGLCACGNHVGRAPTQIMRHIAQAQAQRLVKEGLL